MSSGALSSRMSLGALKKLVSSSSTGTTFLDFQDLQTGIARQKRLCSSIRFRILNLRSLAVESNYKSMAHTWWGFKTRYRGTEPSEGLGCSRVLETGR